MGADKVNAPVPRCCIRCDTNGSKPIANWMITFFFEFGYSHERCHNRMRKYKLGTVVLHGTR